MSEAMTIPQQKSKALAPLERLKMSLNMASVQEQFNNALADAAPLFIASIIDLVGSSKGLQECEPAAIIREALKAAVLRLPIARGLGFAWMVPRRVKGIWTPQMQVGWKGWVQLAQRTAQYKYINAGPIFEGETPVIDRLSGAVQIEGEPKGERPIGYFAYFRLLNGFEKTLCWPMDRMVAHRNRYVPEWNKPGSAWVTHPEEQAIKTILSMLLRKYGILSVEMQKALEAEIEGEVEQPGAKTQIIDLTEPPAPEIRATVEPVAAPAPPTPPETPKRGPGRPKKAAAPAPPPEPQEQPEGPVWLGILQEELRGYQHRHGGALPEGYPEEIMDEAVASRWIDFFTRDWNEEPQPEEPEQAPAGPKPGF
jgi:recombination protein RecT